MCQNISNQRVRTCGATKAVNLVGWLSRAPHNSLAHESPTEKRLELIVGQ